MGGAGMPTEQPRGPLKPGDPGQLRLGAVPETSSLTEAPPSDGGHRQVQLLQ